MKSINGAKLSPKMLDGSNDIDTLCLRAVHALMKDGASRKKLSPRDICAQKRAKLNDVSNEIELSNLEDPFKMVVAPPLQGSLDSTCKRTEVHSMHVFQRQSRQILWKLGQRNKMSKTSKIWSG
jgi:hypothetical protein